MNALAAVRRVCARARRSLSRPELSVAERIVLWLGASGVVALLVAQIAEGHGL